ncbi:MAG: hypothetical protein IH884_09910, partial [Myxococcales bacterium]|nr:hypothetical protein [Myxococcales bacterium]
WWRRLRWAPLALVVLLVVGYLYVTRDLRPYFRERHGELAAHRIEESVVSGDHVVERLTIRSTSGLAVRLSVKRPLDSVAVRRPTVLLLGGHETGRDAVDLIPDTRGVVLAAIDYPLEGSHRIKGLAVLRAIPRIQRAVVDTPPAVQLAADWMLRQPYVDPARLELVGASLGAPFACIVGGLDERFGRVWSVHGGALPHLMIDHGLRSRVAFGPARRLLARFAVLIGFGATLAPEHWVGSIAPREFVMINALDDERLPRECIQGLYDAARQPKEIIWLPGQHVDPDRKEIVRGLVDIVLDRIESDEPIPPSD